MNWGGGPKHSAHNTLSGLPYPHQSEGGGSAYPGRKKDQIMGGVQNVLHITKLTPALHMIFTFYLYSAFNQAKKFFNPKAKAYLEVRTHWYPFSSSNKHSLSISFV